MSKKSKKGPIKCSRCLTVLKSYCYSFIRTDIPLADQGVQLAHATLEAGKYFSHPDGVHLVVLAVKNKKKLLKVAEKLTGKVQFRMFHESDDDMHETAIATEAVYGETRALFMNYQLWKPDASN